MEAAFFGPPGTRLFGVYHPPLDGTEGKLAVLICNPLFQEYIRAHRALRQLAEQLAQVGCHVLRFDYAGTGDSSGTLAETGLQDWRESIALAETELFELSGARSITLVGLRFGATLAALHGSNRIAKTLLWDPVIDGASYIEELEKMHTSMLVDSDRYPVRRRPVFHQGATELLGFRVPDELLEQIRQTKLPSRFDESNRVIDMIVSEEREDYQAYLKHREPRPGLPNYVLVPGPGQWTNLKKFDDMLMPAEILGTIVSRLLSRTT